ncbi:MAG: hypothetical protein H7Y17_13775, partial [Chlorobia bacterium]|nr:hypothetical protein [Fimbriimonadaceae bacterium]
MKSALFLVGSIVLTGIIGFWPEQRPESFEQFLKRRMPHLFQSGEGLVANEAIWLPESKRLQRAKIDFQTGLVIPTYPFGQYLEKLPEDDQRTHNYRRQLAIFFKNRQQVLSLKLEYLKQVREVNSSMLAGTPAYFANKVGAWNGDIMWAPASISAELNLIAGDEARSIFGPIPDLDVSVLGTRTL